RSTSSGAAELVGRADLIAVAAVEHVVLGVHARIAARAQAGRAVRDAGAGAAARRRSGADGRRRAAVVRVAREIDARATDLGQTGAAHARRVRAVLIVSTRATQRPA